MPHRGACAERLRLSLPPPTLPACLAAAAPQRAEDGKRLVQVWILQPYCDRGTLNDAIDRGWLRTAPDGPPDPVAVLLTAQASRGVWLAAG